MAEIPDSIKDKIINFIKLLELGNIRIKKAYIYGSYATGNTDKWSDIDIALVSDDFSGDMFMDRLRLTNFVYEAGWDISPLPFRTSDFEDSLFARDEIINKGFQII